MIAYVSPEELEDLNREQDAHEVSTFKPVNPLSAEEYEDMGIDPELFGVTKSKIENGITDNYVSFYITATFRNKPNIVLPDKWVGITPLGYHVEANFRYDWNDPDVNWDDLKIGHALLNYLDESDSNLIRAKISNDID